MHPTTYGSNIIGTNLINVCKANGCQNLSISMPDKSELSTLYHNQGDILLVFSITTSPDGGTQLTIQSYNCTLEVLHKITKELKDNLEDLHVHIP
jgi:hypothetical protein